MKSIPNKSFIIATLATMAPLAHAHGPQIQLSRDATSGKIITRQIFDTTLYHEGLSNLTSPTSVYVIPMLPPSPSTVVGPTTVFQSRPDQSTNIVTGLYNYGGPGIAYQYDSSAGGNLAGVNWANSGSLTLPNLQGSTFTFNLLSGLEYWNGSSFVDAGTEQVQVSRGSGASLVSTITSDTGPFGQFSFAAVGVYSANPHSSAAYTLLGNGVSSSTASDDGVYRLQLQIASTASGVGPSDPFTYIFSKNASESNLNAAVNSLGYSASSVQNSLPEPSSLALIGMTALVAMRRQRSH